MNDLLSYYGLLDAKIRASDQDLPVQLCGTTTPTQILRTSGSGLSTEICRIHRKYYLCTEGNYYSLTGFLMFYFIHDIDFNQSHYIEVAQGGVSNRAIQ